MNSAFQVFILGMLFVCGLSAEAQIGLEGFSTGRYEIRKSKSRSPASATESPLVTDSDGVKVRTLKGSELATEENKHKEPEHSATESAKKTTEKTTDKKEKQEAEEKPSETKQVQEPSLKEQAESLFSSKAQEIYDFYRDQVNPDDPRNNRVELDIKPLVAYIDSQSNYSYRNYQSFFDALKVKSNVWFTPRIGVTGQIMFSLAADVDSIGSNNSRIPAKHEFVDLGVNFRTFFGVSPKSSSMQFSVIYSDNKMTVPSDNTSRSRLKTQGFGVNFQARIPSSENYSWLAGGSFFPRLQHTESATGATFTSGSPADSARFGVEVGGEWKFSRNNQILWELNGSVERNVFDGVAASSDPSTGLTPSNVSVTNALYMFSLGYRWGH